MGTERRWGQQMSPAHLGPTASGVPLTAGMALCWCLLLLTGLSKVTEPCIQENCTASLQQHSAHFLGRGQQQLVIIMEVVEHI